MQKIIFTVFGSFTNCFDSETTKNWKKKLFEQPQVYILGFNLHFTIILYSIPVYSPKWSINNKFEYEWIEKFFQLKWTVYVGSYHSNAPTQNSATQRDMTTLFKASKCLSGNTYLWCQSVILCDFILFYQQVIFTIFLIVSTIFNIQKTPIT